jgi:hypothetical protein
MAWGNTKIPRPSGVPVLKGMIWKRREGYWHCSEKDYVNSAGWPRCPECRETLEKQYIDLGREHLDKSWQPYHHVDFAGHKCGAKLMIWAE